MRGKPIVHPIINCVLTRSNQKPEFLIGPNLLDDRISDQGTDDRDINSKLKEGGEMARQRSTVLERLGRGTALLNILGTTGGLVAGVIRHSHGLRE